ncbi:MAG: hypothetical protein IH600_16005 [Bacteroidetes bacterium]|nr:hypothetical protein [Bacteroidota bacterium]
MVKTKFTRTSPAAYAEKIGIPPGWFVIRHGLISKKSARRKYTGRWFQISSDKRTVYRILRFGATVGRDKDSDCERIVIDWDAWLDLYDREVDVESPMELKLSPAKFYHFPRLAVSHPDPTVRMAGWLGLTSVCLGILSVVLSFVL